MLANLHAGNVVSLDDPEGFASQRRILPSSYGACPAKQDQLPCLVYRRGGLHASSPPVTTSCKAVYCEHRILHQQSGQGALQLHYSCMSTCFSGVQVDLAVDADEDLLPVQERCQTC